MATINSGTTGTSRTDSMASNTFKSGINFNNNTRSRKGGSASKSTGSSSGGNRSGASHGGSNKTKAHRNIGVGRIVLVVVLLGSAAGLGFAAYTLMEYAESSLAKDRFHSISQRAEANAEWVLQEKKQAADALAKMMGSVNPYASEWPNVYMEGYQDIASSLKLITSGSLSFCPIVQGFGQESDEQQKFEEFYYNLYENEWGYPNGTGQSSFGKGIFGYGYDVINKKAWPDYRYPVISNYTAHRIPNPGNIMVPFVQSDFGNHTALMLDVNFEFHRATAIQNVMACSEERKETNNLDMECGSITDMLWQPTKAKDVTAGPAGIFFSPIYPRLDDTTLTGFILHKQVWHDLLQHAFEGDVTGIRVVLHTDSGAEHTYNVENGEVNYVGNRTHYCVKKATERTKLVGIGEQQECDPNDEWAPFDDLHYLYDETNDAYRSLNMPITKGIFSNETVEYYMDIYATDEFVSQFGCIRSGRHSEVTVTDDHKIHISTLACVAIVLVMVFTSLLFVSYDYCVRKEFDSKERLLEAKRRFVRYVSHEVRTPLNTVCMGLTLLQNDLSSALSNSGSGSNGNGNSKDKNMKSRQQVNHLASLRKSINANTTNDLGDDVVVLKREDVEEWMSLSTQVFQNADAAVGVLSDLLNYDKIQMGTLTLELSLINLWGALEKTVEEFQMTAKEKYVHLKLDFSPLMSSLLYTNDNSNNGEDNKKGGANLNSRGGSGKGIQPIENSMSLKTATKLLKASDLPAIIRNCKVVGDKIRLIQVFRNLISNGLKFSKEYSNMTVLVSLDSLPERKQKLEKISLHKNILAEITKIGSVSIEVIDDGVGMTNEQVATVFEDGTQFDANKLQAGGGSGLGLNIARGIVLEHGGSLTCSSEGLGKGSIFTLSTSLYSDSSSSMLHDTAKTAATSNGDLQCMDAIPDEENAIESEAFTIPLLRVLVVDDSVTNRKLCRRLLERNGHTTDGACDGKEAVEMVKESLQSGTFYDCILLDYEMPVMNGPDACQLMRKMGCSSYIAGVTGNVMSEDVDHFRNCGANWVLPKPFQLKVLEDQWVEDGVTAFTQSERSGGCDMVRVESSHALIEMGDGIASGLAVTFDSKVNLPANN